jgi:hypothetical protein
VFASEIADRVYKHDQEWRGLTLVMANGSRREPRVAY